MRLTQRNRIALVAIVVTAAVLRIYHLAQPMRYDEAWSFLHYSSQPLSIALSDYTLPNNHVFHTLLVWITTRLLGNAPWVVRLPALLAGIALVPAAYLVTRRFGTTAAALVAAALVAALPSMVLYSTNARGYMIIATAFMALLLVGDEILVAPTRRLWFFFALIVAVGAWTAPIMMYPAGCVALWLIIETARRGGVEAVRRILPPLIAATALAIALTLIAYAPVILRSGIAPLISNRFVVALPWGKFVASLLEFVRAVRMALGTGLSRIAMIAGAVAVLGALLATTEERAKRLTLLGAVTCWSALLLLWSRHAPPGRVFLFLVPLLCVYAGLGTAAFAARIAQRLRLNAAPITLALATVLVIATGVIPIAQRAVFTSEETDWYGLRDAPAVASYLLSELRDGDRLVTVEIGPPLGYYLQTLGGKPIETFTGADRRGRIVVVTNADHQQTVPIIEQSHREVPWGNYGPPVLVRTIGHASVFTLTPGDSASH